MKNRRNYLKARKKQFKWSQLGYVSKDALCPLCGANTLVQIDKYDSWACPSCGEWLDEACGDPDCPYCSLRPQTAFEAYALADVEAGSAGLKKRWRCDNYQHKTNGRKRHERRRKAVQDSRSF
ncbi:MAG: hypothetical protein K1W27_01200 [Lachnospiraceae bacterium]|jgi:DNA-directed RNA polymerase subunit RPC12/RpoP|nr:hypothetical protein C804_05419 [Lachnospiraceae bacterium A4]